jgi:hypothetical protein
MRRITGGRPLFNLVSSWFEAARLAADMQRVIALRMIRLAAGGPLASREARRMVSEKIAAFGESQVAAMAALASGSTLKHAAKKAHRPYRRRVRANRRRLSGKT